LQVWGNLDSRSFRPVARRKIVYVLDDDPDMLRGLERLLTVQGFSPQLFHSTETFFASVNGEDAMCLLLDVHLNGVSGIEVKRRLSRSGMDIPVIFITAKDNEATRKLTQEVGCIAYLPKPLSAKSLIEAIGLVNQYNPTAGHPPD
jgi:FixJ family two-component response regulator